MRAAASVVILLLLDSMNRFLTRDRASVLGGLEAGTLDTEREQQTVLYTCCYCGHITVKTVIWRPAIWDS